MGNERARVTVFYVCCLCIAVWIACMIVGYTVAFGKEYQPDTREALLIRPERPVQRAQPSVPCLTPPERPKRVTWVVRAKDGTVIIIGAIDVRQRC